MINNKNLFDDKYKHYITISDNQMSHNKLVNMIILNLMHKTILVASQSSEIIKITTKRLVLTNQYFTAQLVQIEGQADYKMLYKLLGAANPFISFYELYLLYALQCPIKLTRQFIRFVINCWKKYQSFQQKQNFIVDFFGNSYLKMKAHENDQVLQAVREVLSFSPLQINNQEWLQNYLSRFKTAKQINRKLLKAAIQKERNSSDQDKLSIKLALLPKMEYEALSNLQNLNTLKSSLKIQLLEKICMELPRKWQAKLLFDQNKQAAYILTHNILKQDEQMVPFHNFLHPQYRNQSNIKEFQIQNLAFETIIKLQDYNKKCSYKLGMNPSDFIVIVKKSQDTYQLSQTKCSINYISPFLQYLGLNNLTLTGQNKIVFQSRYQPLYRKTDFSKQLQKSISPDKIYDTNNAIKWIIYFDHVFCKLFGRGKTSILQSYSSNDRKWEKYILDKIADHQYVQNESYLLHSWTICVLDSLLNDYAPPKSSKNVDKKEQMLSVITSQNIKSIFQQISREKHKQQPYNQNRVQILVKMIYFQQNLYFLQDGIRSFFLHNKNLSQLSPQQRYLCMYELARLVQLNILLILSLFRIWNKQDRQKIKISQEKFKNIIQKLQHKISPKREQKRYQQYWLQKNMIQQQDQIKKQEQQKQIQSSIASIKNTLNNILAKPAKLFQEKFENLNKQSENKQINKSSLISTKASFLFVKIFSQLNIYNLVEFIFIQKQIRDIKNKQKFLTSSQIYNMLNKIQQKLQGMKIKTEIKPSYGETKQKVKQIY